MQRNTLVDHLRGYACFLVLFGHVIMGVRNAGVPMPPFFAALETFIWSFHVALFLFLSGNVYRLTDGWRSKKTRLGFIGYKAINLGVPYVAFSVVYICINSFVGSANTDFQLSDILYIWKTPVAQYWYLYALFFLLVIWALLADIIKPWLLTVLAVALAYLVPAFGGTLGVFSYAIDGAFAFGLGSCLCIATLEKMPRIGKCAVILLHLVLGFALVHYGKTTQFAYKELLIVVGIYASIQLISLLQTSKILAKALAFMNRYSLQIYLLHTIFTAGVRIVLMRLGILSWPLHLLIGLAAGLGASVFAAWVAKKTKVLDFFFFPSKTVRAFNKAKWAEFTKKFRL